MRGNGARGGIRTPDARLRTAALYPLSYAGGARAILPYHRPVAGRIVLYEREGCHLCEEAAAVLDAVIGADRYERVDIEADDDLLVRYGHRIPVVAVDGVDRLELLISAPDVRALADQV